MAEENNTLDAATELLFMANGFNTHSILKLTAEEAVRNGPMMRCSERPPRLIYMSTPGNDISIAFRKKKWSSSYNSHDIALAITDDFVHLPGGKKLGEEEVETITVFSPDGQIRNRTGPSAYVNLQGQFVDYKEDSRQGTLRILSEEGSVELRFPVSQDVGVMVANEHQDYTGLASKIIEHAGLPQEFDATMSENYFALRMPSNDEAVDMCIWYDSIMFFMPYLGLGRAPEQIHALTHGLNSYEGRDIGTVKNRSGVVKHPHQFMYVIPMGDVCDAVSFLMRLNQLPRT
ncbi:hypothetical protein ACFL1B_01755 [Nanoarchaeota archaeon]